MTRPSPVVRASLRAVLGRRRPCRSSRRYRAQTVTQQGWNPKEMLAKETYVKPPEIVERIVTAPRNNVAFTNPSPDHKYFLKTESEGLPTIDVFGKLALSPRRRRDRLQGQSRARADDARQRRPHAHRSHERRDAHDRDAQGRDGEQRRVVAGRQEHRLHRELRRARRTSSSPTSRPASRCRSRKTPLLATRVTTFDWTADGKNVVAVLLPDGRGRRAEAPRRRNGAARAHERSGQGAPEPQLREPAPRSVRQGSARLLHARPARRRST